MNKATTLISWLMLGIAGLSWCGVAYGSMWLEASARERGSIAKTAEQKAEEAAHLARLKTIASETLFERDQLNALAAPDIVSIANAIEEAGRDIGVEARVSSAVPSGTATALPDGSSIQGLAFFVQAEGTFSGVVQLVRVLESFPGFSSISRFELDRPQSSGATRPWRTSVRLEILTTSDIAS